MWRAISPAGDRAAGVFPLDILPHLTLTGAHPRSFSALRVSRVITF